MSFSTRFPCLVEHKNMSLQQTFINDNRSIQNGSPLQGPRAGAPVGNVRKRAGTRVDSNTAARQTHRKHYGIKGHLRRAFMSAFLTVLINQSMLRVPMHRGLFSLSFDLSFLCPLTPAVLARSPRRQRFKQTTRRFYGSAFAPPVITAGRTDKRRTEVRRRRTRSASAARIGSLSEQPSQTRRHASPFKVAHTPTDTTRLCSIFIRLDDVVAQQKPKPSKRKQPKNPNLVSPCKWALNQNAAWAVFPFIPVFCIHVFVWGCLKDIFKIRCRR